MNEAIENAIKHLAGKCNETLDATAALHYSQAALNLAQTAATLANTKKHLG